jgi:hypothetical protein
VNPISTAWWSVALLSTVMAQAPTPPPAAATPAAAARAARRAACREPKVHDAIGAGLRWLRAAQDASGRWRSEEHGGGEAYDIGVSGLAVLALLGNGDATHHDAARRGAAWLASQFDPNGRIPAATHDFVYSHVIATLALFDAADQLDDATCRSRATAAMHYLCEHRNPDTAWRYQPRDGDNDTSITGWCLDVLHSAFAAGIDVPPVAVAVPMAWLATVTDPSGRAGYTKIGEGSARLVEHRGFPPERGATLPAIALRCRAAWNTRASAELDRAAVGVLLGRAPSSDAEARDTYYWFHGSEAVHAAGDAAARKAWDAALHRALLPQQQTKGDLPGGWPADDVWGRVGGRVASSSLAMLALQAPWRTLHTPLLGPVPSTGPLAPARKLAEQGRFAAARKALDAVGDPPPPAVPAAALQRLRWAIEMEIAGLEHRVQRIEVIEANPWRRLLALEDLIAGLDGLPAAEQAVRRRDALLADPAVRAERDAERELHAVSTKLAPGKPPTPAQKKKLQAIVDRWPATEAAKAARQLLGIR